MSLLLTYVICVCLLKKAVLVFLSLFFLLPCSPRDYRGNKKMKNLLPAFVHWVESEAICSSYSKAWPLFSRSLEPQLCQVSRSIAVRFHPKKNRDVQPVRPSWELKIWVIFALGENRNTSFCEMEAFLWVFCFDLMEMSFAFIILHLKRSNSSYWCKIFWLPQNEVLP